MRGPADVGPGITTVRCVLTLTARPHPLQLLAPVPGIAALSAETGADEIMIVSDVYDHAARLRSFELIAEAGGS